MIEKEINLPFEHTFQVRLNTRDALLMRVIVEKNPLLYHSISHYIRCSIIKLNREHGGYGTDHLKRDVVDLEVGKQWQETTTGIDKNKFEYDGVKCTKM